MESFVGLRRSLGQINLGLFQELEKRVSEQRVFQRNFIGSAVLRISHSLENRTNIACILRDRPSMTSGVNQGNWAFSKRIFYGYIFEFAVKPR